jgi:ribosome-associated protein
VRGPEAGSWNQADEFRAGCATLRASVQRSYPLNRQAAPGAPVSETPVTGAPEDTQQNVTVSLEEMILTRLDEDKAQDIVMIDLKDKSSVADTMIVASGRSHRHVGALADHLLRALKEAGHGKARVEGLPHCDWVLIDAGDVIIHLFRPEVRSFYNIEKIWSVEPPARSAAN